MLYGIRRDLQEQLVRKDIECECMCRTGATGIRISCGRLAERPANVWFILRNMIRG